jgi:8-oxo-dGTP pyrophosphatase MutT (NUDIX family)
MEPIYPVPIDVGEPPSGRPRPRRFQFCYSEDTEILSRRGWLHFNELTYQDEVATRTPEGVFEWQRPGTIVWEPYEGDMVWFHSKTVDILVTPNHRMLHRVRHRHGAPDGSDEYAEALTLAEDLVDQPGGVGLVATSRWEGGSDSDVVLISSSDRKPGKRSSEHQKDIVFKAQDFAAFMGMWLSEGHLGSSRGGDYPVCVTQTPKGKGYEEYHDLLVRILGREPLQVNQARSAEWRFGSKALYEFLQTCGGHAHEKRIPRQILDMTKECLEIFWHFYWLGDGSTMRAPGRNDSQVVSTSSKGMADDFQELFQKLGRWGIIQKTEKWYPSYIGKTHRPNYRLVFRAGEVAYAHKKDRVPYNGMIGCVGVPNGIVYVRRNNRPLFASNTVGWNLPVGQPGTEGIKLANFQILRDYAEMPSIPRNCIEICSNDLINLDWDVVPTQDAQRAMQGNPAKREDFEKRKAEVMEFWSNPDPDQYDSFEEWFTAVCEDNLVLDAIALHLVPTVGKGHGPCGSNVGALAALDGSMIKPLLNEWGGRPRSPNPSYQQFVWGVPRIDLMDIINLGPGATIEDIKDINPMLDELTETVDEWSADQLFYVKMKNRTWTPYGYGPMEQGMLPAAIIFARQTWQWEFYRSGSLPAVFLDPGETIANAEEARQLQEAINMLGGDLGAKHQVIVLPPGSNVMPQKDVDLTDQLDEWLAALMCMPFGLSISDLGITPKIASLSSPSSSKSQAATAADHTVRRSTIPRAKRLKKKIFDRVIQKLMGQADMEWSWGIVEEGESRDDQVKNAMALVGAGIPVSTIDEQRIALELDPLGLPWTTVPIIATATGQVIPFPTAEDLAKDPTIGSGQPPTPPGLPPGSPGAPPAGPGKPPALGPGPKTPPKPAKPAAADTAPASPAHAASESVVANPPKDQTNSTTSSKVFNDEISILRRYLKRGKSLDNFEPHAITKAAFGVALRNPSLDPETTIRIIKAATDRVNRRESALTKPRAAVVAGLGALAGQLSRGQITAAEFATQGTGVMQDGYQAAYEAGGQGASSELGTETVPDFTEKAAARAATQTTYLDGFATDIMAGVDTGELAARAGMYAAGLTAPYEEGYVDTGTADDPSASIVWNLGDDSDHCENCLELDGQSFSADDLPGFPGDGGFDNDVLCEGGCLCNCSLSFESDGQTLAQTDQPSGARDNAMAGKGFVTLEDVENALKGKDALPACPLCGSPNTGLMPPDFETLRCDDCGRNSALKDFSAGSPLASGFVPFDLQGDRIPVKKKPRKKTKDASSADTLAADSHVVAAGLAVRAENTGRVLMLQRMHDPTDPASGTFEFGGGHLEPGETPFEAACREWSEEVGCAVPDGQVVSMWESPNGIYQGFVLSVPSESDVNINLDRPETDNPDADVHAKPETSVWMDIDHIHGMPALRTELQADLPRVLPALRAPARSAVKGGKAEPDPQPATMPRMMGRSISEDDVKTYLESHYENSDLTWVSRCLWSADHVLLSDVDWQHRPGGIDEDKVNEMAEKLGEGWEPHPVVLVAPDATSKMAVADGYHRMFAIAQQASKNDGADVVEAWVGSPKPGNTGWRADLSAMQVTGVTNHPGNQ